mgnify:CR=1 FL=1|tara:strand:+ start:1043 stop:2587 length:1545 start_codon:yes stop_codon:yes gene_type:complete
MPTLAGINGRSLVPDLSGTLNLALGAFGTPQSRAAEEEKLLAAQQSRQIQAQNQATLQEALSGILSGGGGAPVAPGGTAGGIRQPGTGSSSAVSNLATASASGFSPEDLEGVKKRQAADAERTKKSFLRLAAVNPQAAQALQGVIQTGNVAEIEAIQAEVDNGTRMARIVQSGESFQDKQKKLADMAANAAAEGKDLTRFVELSNMSEGQLDVELDKMLLQGTDISEITKAATGAGKKFTKGTGVRTDLGGGNFAIVTPVLDETTGLVTNQVSAIPGELVSTIGETGEQLTTRRIGEAGGKAGAVADVAIETSEEIASEKKKGTAKQTRIQTEIDSGLTAADSLPTLNRSLDILERMETGGIDNAILEGARFFGVESAEEAELSNSLSKVVLSQLRTIFGAAFTAAEGERLISIEASFGKSTAGNLALLKQAKKLAERAARRGIKAAEKNGDQDLADEIREAMNLNLGTPDQPATVDGQDVNAPAAAGPVEGQTATNPTTGATLIFRGGAWQAQ